MDDDLAAEVGLESFAAYEARMRARA